MPPATHRPATTRWPHSTAPTSACCSSAGTTGDLDAQADALLALLDAVYVAHQREGVGRLSTNSGTPGKTSPASCPAYERVASPRWILHVDLDQFLASVEERRHPELAGLPVIVGGSGDPTEPRKVVTCASYPARTFGVHAGMPLRTAARKCPDATFLASDPAAYDAASDEVMNLLRGLGYPVEVWGWDEAYVGADVGDPVELAERIRTTIAAETQLSCSVGISDNKQRAKVATGFAKPDGICQLTDENWMPVMGGREPDALWGIGPEDRGKACGDRHYNRRATGGDGRRHTHCGVWSHHRTVVTAAGQGRRRHDGQRRAVDPTVAQSRRHLPPRPHRPRRDGLGGRGIGASNTGGGDGGVADRHPGGGDRPQRGLSSPAPRFANSLSRASTPTSSCRPRCGYSTCSNSTGRSGYWACGWNSRRRKSVDSAPRARATPLSRPGRRVNDLSSRHQLQ